MYCPYYTLLHREIPGDPSAENRSFTEQAGTDEDKKKEKDWDLWKTGKDSWS